MSTPAPLPPDGILSLCLRWLTALRNPSKAYDEENYKSFEAKVRQLCAEQGESDLSLSEWTPYKTLEGEEKNPPFPLGGECALSASVEGLVKEAKLVLGEEFKDGGA